MRYVGQSCAFVALEVVGVVAQSAHQRVSHSVGTGIERVVCSVARTDGSGGSLQYQVFNVDRKRVIGECGNPIVALSCCFDDHVARPVDHVGVVARTAAHRINACPTVERVVA